MALYYNQPFDLNEPLIVDGTVVLPDHSGNQVAYFSFTPNIKDLDSEGQPRTHIRFGFRGKTVSIDRNKNKLVTKTGITPAGQPLACRIILDKTSITAFLNDDQLFQKPHGQSLGKVWFLLRAGNKADRTGGITQFDNIRISRIDVSVAPSGLVGHWCLDETSGTKAVESSLNANHGAVSDPKWVPGKIDGALAVNGKFIRVNVFKPKGLPIGKEAITMSAWVQCSDTFGSWHMAVAYGAPYDNQSIYIGRNNSALVGGAYGNDVFGIADFWQENINQWKHIALTFDGVSTAKLFVDGQERAREDKFKVWNIVPTLLRIGDQVNDNGEYWTGAIDNVMIHNRALSASEIQSVMNDTRNESEGGHVLTSNIDLTDTEQWTTIGGPPPISRDGLFVFRQSGPDTASIHKVNGFAMQSQAVFPLSTGNADSFSFGFGGGNSRGGAAYRVVFYSGGQVDLLDKKGEIKKARNCYELKSIFSWKIEYNQKIISVFINDKQVLTHTTPEQKTGHLVLGAFLKEGMQLTLKDLELTLIE